MCFGLKSRIAQTKREHELIRVTHRTASIVLCHFFEQRVAAADEFDEFLEGMAK
jgi:hypothetical protein